MTLERQSINIQNTIRKVSYINGKKCVKCYYYDEFPCNICTLFDSNIGYNISHRHMDWNEFIINMSPTFLIKKLTKVPTNYDEYCELYDIYHDLPELVYQ